MLEDAQLVVIGTLCLVSSVEGAFWGNGVDDFDRDDSNWIETPEDAARDDAHADEMMSKDY